MNVIDIRHSLIKDKISRLRSIETSSADFRNLVEQLTLLLAFPATQDLPLAHSQVQTPLENTDAFTLSTPGPILVPILRAGLGMLTAMQKILPQADIGHIGVRRDEKTLKPISYLYKVPQPAKDRRVFLLDPMLATGGSAIYAIERLKADQVGEISLLCLLAAPEGIRELHKVHPEVKIYTASVERELNDKGFILPGLGDAGDRYFGTL